MWIWCSTSALVKWRQLLCQQVRHCRKHAAVHASNVQFDSDTDATSLRWPIWPSACLSDRMPVTS